MFDNLMNPDDGKPRGRVNRQLRRLFRWLLTLRGSPKSIGLGVAIGLFCASSPLLGLHLVLAIVLATLLGANRPAAVTTTFLNNPATFVPVYALEYWIGSHFWPGPPVARVKQVLGELVDQLTGTGFFHFKQNFTAVLELGRDIIIPLLIGGTLLGLVVGTAAYYPTMAVVSKLRNKRQERKGRKDASAA